MQALVNFITSNWLWIVVAGGMILMHFSHTGHAGHGSNAAGSHQGHGGCGGHGHGPSADDAQSRDSRTMPGSSNPPHGPAHHHSGGDNPQGW